MSNSTVEKPVRITACILALNEEGKLEEAIRTLSGWTDRIIVIDNESTDRTAEIARKRADVVLPALDS